MRCAMRSACVLLLGRVLEELRGRELAGAAARREVVALVPQHADDLGRQRLVQQLADLCAAVRVVGRHGAEFHVLAGAGADRLDVGDEAARIVAAVFVGRVHRGALPGFVIVLRRGPCAVCAGATTRPPCRTRRARATAHRTTDISALQHDVAAPHGRARLLVVEVGGEPGPLQFHLEAQQPQPFTRFHGVASARCPGVGRYARVRRGALSAPRSSAVTSPGHRRGRVRPAAGDARRAPPVGSAHVHAWRGSPASQQRRTLPPDHRAPGCHRLRQCSGSRLSPPRPRALSPWRARAPRACPRPSCPDP